jgi:Methylamine utilisation protein MauE
MKKSQWLYELIVFLLALLFLYTAFSKLVDMRHFVRAIHNQPFPKSVDPFLILGVPLVEIITGVALLRIKSRKLGLIASAILMFSFSIYVSLAVFHVFKRVPCGCAGVFQGMSWPVHLVFNIAFLILACIGLLIHYHKEKANATGLRHGALN